MNIILVAGAVAIVVLLVVALKKSKNSGTDTASEEARNEAWKGTKRTSERVSGSDNAAVKASDKLNGAQSEVFKASGVYTSKIEKKSYGPLVDPIIEEGNKALSEMGRIYVSSNDENIKAKITEIMTITDKIMQEAINDPDDIPQIKKFFSYYLPTTIKLLNSYDRMDSQGISGDNIDKTKSNINEMLDVAIDAYKKRLDSLFENQALDIETEIDVMNQMLKREGLTGNKDFNLKEGTTNG